MRVDLWYGTEIADRWPGELEKMPKLFKNLKKGFPELSVTSVAPPGIMKKYRMLITESAIGSHSVPIEYWTSDATNKELGYHTHNIFRYFGKFPPPIARHLIKTYTREGDLVVDPMCGSGTTSLEAYLLKRHSYCFDVNPLSVLVSQTKTTTVSGKAIQSAQKRLEALISENNHPNYEPNFLRNYPEWFLPETVSSLSNIKDSIRRLNCKKSMKDIFLVAFLSCVRKASRATSQQGRLFKDVDSAIRNVVPLFFKKVNQIINSLSELPIHEDLKVSTEMRSASSLPKTGYRKKVKLLICHPPYFNLYKYSRINVLELAWMDEIDICSLRKLEVKEFFKVGKSENAPIYVENMASVLINLKGYLQKGGMLALMNGDTVIKGEFVPVNKMIMDKLRNDFEIEKIALRIPKFTEASWAASQRRKTGQVGVNMCDFVYILRRK